MMCVSKKLSITPACPAADYVPTASTRRQTGTTVSTITISPSSRHHHNHRSRRRSRRARSLRARRRNIAPSSDEDQRGGATGRDGWTEKGLDERKGSDEAADIKWGLPPPRWRTEKRKRGYNRYAALSSTEEDANFESKEYRSAGYGVGIIGVGGELALRRLKKCDNLDERLGRITLLEQDSGINYSPGDAPADFLTKLQQEQQHPDADAAGYNGWKKLPPGVSDFTFSFPSTLTETYTTARGMATTRSRTIAAASSLLDPPSISHNNGCIVGDGNKAVVLSPPSASASFTSHSPHVLFRGEESAEQNLFPSSLAWEADMSLRYLLEKANSLSQASLASSRAVLSSRPAFPSRPAQVAPLRPCTLLSSKHIPILTKGRIPVTPTRLCYDSLPLQKFILPAAARKLRTRGRGISVSLPAGSIDTTAPSFGSIDDPARMEQTKEKREVEEKESGYYGLPLSASRRNDAGVLKNKKLAMTGGSWPEQELLRMWKDSGEDSSSSSTITTPTALIGSERRRPGTMKKSRVFSTMASGGGGEDDAKVVDADWLEYIMISPRINFGQGQGAVGNGNEKFDVPVITSTVAPTGFEDEDKGAKRVTGNDIFAGGDRKGEEEKDLLVELFGEREIEIENLSGGREGRGLGDDLGLASKMEMGESWGWDIISRVEAYD